MLVDFGRANLLDKARQQPERIREVLDRARTEGLLDTIEAVRGTLAQPISLGYANAGVVAAVGDAVRGIHVGDLVASAGPHAEAVSVPATMAAVVPGGVAAEHACFASVAAVGLEAIRLADCQIGERFVVTGLGLIGLLTLQLLLAQGCEVIGIDPQSPRRALAERLGASTAEPGAAAASLAAELSRGQGVDGVLICASTKSSDPVREAAQMCRERGRIVLVGVTGLELTRADFYEKELSFQVSRAYGPGRYDPSYEAGHDYPFGLVRWTAGRNMEAVLSLMASGRLDVGPLITHTFDFDDAPAAYDVLVEDPSALGIVLRYPQPPATPAAPPLGSNIGAVDHTAAVGDIAVIGAGTFATRTLLPAIADVGGHVRVIASPGGISAGIAADKVGANATSDVDEVFEDAGVAALFVATRHDSHASLAVRAIEVGKAAYIEKPLALKDDHLDEIVAAAERRLASSHALPVLTVGFNRRFAPISVRMRELLGGLRAPKVVTITVNAGALPPDHWTQDPEIGGGRVLGEGCHFVDLARFLVGSPITDVSTRYLGRTPTDDTATISLGFEDGSMATVHYLANGSPRVAKERVEVFCQGRVLVNDDFRSLRAYGWRGVRSIRRRRQDKGHTASVAAFLDAARSGGPAPIPFDELIEVSRAAIRAGTRT